MRCGQMDASSDRMNERQDAEEKASARTCSAKTCNCICCPCLRSAGCWPRSGKQIRISAALPCRRIAPSKVQAQMSSPNPSLSDPHHTRHARKVLLRFFRSNLHFRCVLRLFRLLQLLRQERLVRSHPSAENLHAGALLCSRSGAHKNSKIPETR